MAKTSAIYKEPIKVICIKATTSIKLIKGGIYSATAIYSSNKTDRIIYLKDTGNYSISYFRLFDGSSLDSVPDFTLERAKSVDVGNIDYTGQFVKCGRYSSSKVLKTDEIYYVEKHEQKQSTRKNWNGTLTTSTDHKFKIRGIKNYVNVYNFLEIPIKEQRNIKLKNLSGQKIKTGEQTRKFLLYTEKEKTQILFETLARVLIDLSGVELSNTADFVTLIKVKGKKYSLVDEDITPFLNSKIQTLLNKF